MLVDVSHARGIQRAFGSKRRRPRDACRREIHISMPSMGKNVLEMGELHETPEDVKDDSPKLEMGDGWMVGICGLRSQD